MSSWTHFHQMTAADFEVEADFVARHGYSFATALIRYLAAELEKTKPQYHHWLGSANESPETLTPYGSR